jgi:hypothetical protein
MKQITCPHCGDTYPDFDVAHVCNKGPYAPRLKPKMNERIKELAEQAGYDWQWDTQIDFGHKEMEKFAELIIQECLDQLHVGDTDEDYDKGAYWSREQIKNHFGVEE